MATDLNASKDKRAGATEPLEGLLTNLSINGNHPADSQFLTPPRASGLPVRVFGSLEPKDSEPSGFSFRCIHNATPEPPSKHLDTSKLTLSSHSAVDSSLTAPNVTIATANADPVPYDVRDEQPPTDLTFFRPEFQRQLARGSQLAEKLCDAIARYQPKTDSALHRLLNDAKSLSDFHTTDTRIVALLGDSGEGKSSVINSLLHCPGVAQTSDAGTACTSVITEYRHQAPHHIAPFTIEVEYLSTLEVRDVVKELLWNYQQMYLPEAEKELSADEYKKCSEQSELAWSTLEAAFGDRPEFRKQLLRDTSPTGKERATSLLLQWSQELQWPEGEQDGIWTSTAQHAEECREKTDQFMHNRLWPFTKIIRVYLRAQVLKTGIVLADLPGLRDTNLARVRATERYLLNADHVFIVAKISRALSDQSLKSSLYVAIAQHIPNEWNESGGQFLNISIVCTKCEEIDIGTLKAKFCGPGKTISTTELEELEASIKAAKNSGDAQRKKLLKHRRDFLFIKARNDFVKAGLQRAYAEKVENKTLEVFCVSNTAYVKHAKKGRLEFVQDSGIPELRRFCHTITAQAQLGESRNFLRARCSNLLNSVRLWMDRVLQDAKDSAATRLTQGQIFEMVEAARRQIHVAIEMATASFKEDIKEQLLEYMDQRNGHWEKAAKTKSDQWNSWHWSTAPTARLSVPRADFVAAQYNAWCLNNGNHSTEKRGHHNWNNEIIWKMRSELDFQWDMVEEEIQNFFDNVGNSISEALVEAQSAMSDLDVAPTLVESLSSRSEDIHYRLGLAKRVTLQAFRTIRRNASEDNSNSYVLNRMLSAYRSASGERGTGKNIRQIYTIQGQITNGNLFPPIAVLIKTDLFELVDQSRHRVQKILDDALDMVRLDVTMAYLAQEHTHPAHTFGSRPKHSHDEGTLPLANRLQDTLPILELELRDIHHVIAQLAEA